LPLCSAELQGQFELTKAINRGLLPSIYFSDDFEEDLQSYVGDYLSQEIAAEAAVRNIPAFSRFLHVAAHFNAGQINFEKMAKDAQVAPSTVRGYFQIMQDTMLGTLLPAWKHSTKKEEVATGKFYLFDTGLARKLQRRNPLVPQTAEYGNALEAFIHHELRCFIEYQSRGSSLHFWRTYSGHEVDFVLNGNIAVEVKSTQNVSGSDLKGIEAFDREYSLSRRVIVCQERYPRLVGNVEVIPVDQFLAMLWAGEFDE
jgi:predicted AAA+ superfamily ATPase